MKNIIITGHSGGLGEAMAETLLAQGATVLGVSRRRNPKLAEKYSTQLQEVALNLSDSAAVSEFIDSEVFTQFCQGKNVWLINNAGSQNPARVLGQQGATEIAQTVALNVAAPLMLADAVVNLAEQAHILHISSGAGSNGYPGWSVYGTTKAALDHHARCVQAENLSAVRIVSLAPGIIDTAMQQAIRDNDQFPNQAGFISLKESGKLQTAESTAQAILNYCQSDKFGQQAVMDIRSL